MERLGYDVWAGKEREATGRLQAGTSVCLRQHCSQELMERAGRERPRQVPQTLQRHDPQAKARIAPGFQTWAGGWLVVPSEEMEPQEGGVGRVTEERPHSTGDVLLNLTHPIL